MSNFDGENVLCRGEVQCGSIESSDSFESNSGHEFLVTHRFELPACPVEILCIFQNEELYKAALMVGVHTSEEWESINLGNIHDLGFRCQEAH